MNNFSKTIKRKTPKNIPFWFMRQAGRYLPEYQALRQEAGSFLNLCLTPKWASEVTLQPVHRFGVDGAILFADILLVPLMMGMDLDFKEGVGPVLTPLENEKGLSNK